ncbi:hypothetical protein H5410_060832, partial [Solanum commersonii]
FEDFTFHINSCDLTNDNFFGSPSTWWNNRIDVKCILKYIYKEEMAILKDDLFEELPTVENKTVFLKSYVELKLYLHYEEEFWRQKA